MRTGDEFREIFNLKYNNINSGVSPGLNDYEISLYLTEAQKEIIEGFYSGSMKGFSFEQQEKIRKNLSAITKETKTVLGSFAKQKDLYKYTITWPNIKVIMNGEEVELIVEKP